MILKQYHCPECGGSPRYFVREARVPVSHGPSVGATGCFRYVAPLSSQDPKLCARCRTQHHFDIKIPDVPPTLECWNGHQWTTEEIDPE